MQKVDSKHFYFYVGCTFKCRTYFTEFSCLLFAGDSNSLCVAPSLVTDQHRWTIYHSKVNLPAALNDPRLAKRESDFFTKTWGLDFVDTEVIPSFYLPQISKEHFTVYQQEISQVIADLEISCSQVKSNGKFFSLIYCRFLTNNL